MTSSGVFSKSELVSNTKLPICTREFLTSRSDEHDLTACSWVGAGTGPMGLHSTSLPITLPPAGPMTHPLDSSGSLPGPSQVRT